MSSSGASEGPSETLPVSSGVSRVLPWLGAAALMVGCTAAFLKVRHAHPSPSDYHFHPHYQELVTLRNGVRVLLRPLKATDRFRLRREMEKLSEQSRQLRFHRPKAALTDEEMRYLTDIDGVSHFALVAGDAHGEGLGVARFIRLGDAPSVADAALVVADRIQGQGLGKVLLLRLRAAAAERGIATLRCEVLSENRAALGLIESISPGARRRWENGAAVIDIPT